MSTATAATMTHGIADAENEAFAKDVVAYLVNRGVIGAASPALPLLLDLFTERPVTVEAFAVFIGCNVKTLRNRFSGAGLGADFKPWVAFARALPVIDRLQREPETSTQRASTDEGYPNEYTFSDHLNTYVGLRPGAARKLSDWRDIVDLFLSHRKVAPNTALLSPRPAVEAAPAAAAADQAVADEQQATLDRERIRFLDKRANERITYKAQRLLGYAGLNADREQLEKIVQEYDQVFNPADWGDVIKRALELRNAGEAFGRRLDPATVSVQPLDHSDEPPRRKGQKVVTLMPFDFPERRRRAQEAAAASRATLKEEAEMPKKPTGPTGIDKPTRNKIRAWLRNLRTAKPEIFATEALQAVNAKFGVEIEYQNFYKTYWNQSEPMPHDIPAADALNAPVAEPEAGTAAGTEHAVVAAQSDVSGSDEGNAAPARDEEPEALPATLTDAVAIGVAQVANKLSISLRSAHLEFGLHSNGDGLLDVRLVGRVTPELADEITAVVFEEFRPQLAATAAKD